MCETMLPRSVSGLRLGKFDLTDYDSKSLSKQFDLALPALQTRESFPVVRRIKLPNNTKGSITMCAMTTSDGVKWDMLNINGRTAFQRDNLTVLWYPPKDAYVVLNEVAAVVYSNPVLDNCLRSASLTIN